MFISAFVSLFNDSLYYLFPQPYYHCIWLPSVFLFVQDFCVFTCNVLLLIPSLFCVLLWQLLLGGRCKGGVLMLFGFAFFLVYSWSVLIHDLPKIWRICLTLSKEQVLHPCSARVKTPKSFSSHALSVWHFGEQKLEGENSPLLRVTSTSELCKTHSCSAELVGERLTPCSGSVLILPPGESHLGYLL